MKTKLDIKVAAMELIANANNMLNHDVYSKNEVSLLLTELSDKLFAFEIDEDDSEKKYSVKSIQDSINHMFGDWDFHEYIDVSVNHDRRIEIEFDERAFRRDAAANIALSLDDEH